MAAEQKPAQAGRPRGRPRLLDPRSRRFEKRVTEGEWAKIQALGGAEWFDRVLANARVPR